MSIPALTAISKLRIPEVDEPVTHRRVIVDHGEEDEKDAPVNVLHTFAKGAVFGLIVAACHILFRRESSESRRMERRDNWIDISKGTARVFIQVCYSLYRPITRRDHQWSAHMDRPWLWHPPADSAARPVLRLLPHHFLHRYVPFHGSFLIIRVTQVYHALGSCASRSSSRQTLRK
jgi:hypothetical protein